MNFFKIEMRDITAAELPEIYVEPGWSFVGTIDNHRAYKQEPYNPTLYYKAINLWNKLF